jgi:hypothetical protein
MRMKMNKRFIVTTIPYGEIKVELGPKATELDAINQVLRMHFVEGFIQPRHIIGVRDGLHC